MLMLEGELVSERHASQSKKTKRKKIQNCIERIKQILEKSKGKEAIKYKDSLSLVETQMFFLDLIENCIKLSDSPSHLSINYLFLEVITLLFK